MSLIRCSRSEPDELILRENSICLPDRLPAVFSASCWLRIRIELSGVRNSCDMLARNSDLYLEVSASSAAFSSSARRACSTSAFLRSTSAFCSASSRGLGGQFLVGVLQFALARLQFDRELLRLREQAFGAHRRFDRVEDDADALRQLVEERERTATEILQRREFDHGLGLAFEQHWQHDDADALRLAQARCDLHELGRDVGQQDAFFLACALSDQAFADAGSSRPGARPARSSIAARSSASASVPARW